MDTKCGPKSLQAKVTFDIRFYFAHGGSENFKNITIDIFKVVHDDGHKIIYIIKKSKLQINHQKINAEMITG